MLTHRVAYLIEEADRALLAAKKMGRNRVLRAGELERTQAIGPATECERDSRLTDSPASVIDQPPLPEVVPITQTPTARLQERIAEFNQKLVADNHFTGAERRPHPRYNVTLEATALAIDESGQPLGAPFVMVTRNISNTGLGVIHTEPLEPGQRFIVELLARERDQVRLIAEVVHCRPVARFFEIGLRFQTCAEES